MHGQYIWHVLHLSCQHMMSHLSGGDGGGSKPTRLSRWSGTYSCTSTTLLMILRSSCMAGMSGAYFHAPSTMNLYCRSTRGGQNRYDSCCHHTLLRLNDIVDIVCLSCMAGMSGAYSHGPPTVNFHRRGGDLTCVRAISHLGCLPLTPSFDSRQATLHLMAAHRLHEHTLTCVMVSYDPKRHEPFGEMYPGKMQHLSSTQQCQRGWQHPLLPVHRKACRGSLARVTWQSLLGAHLVDAGRQQLDDGEVFTGALHRLPGRPIVKRSLHLHMLTSMAPCVRLWYSNHKLPSGSMLLSCFCCLRLMVMTRYRAFPMTLV